MILVNATKSNDNLIIALIMSSALGLLGIFLLMSMVFIVAWQSRVNQGGGGDDSGLEVITNKLWTWVDLLRTSWITS